MTGPSFFQGLFLRGMAASCRLVVVGHPSQDFARGGDRVDIIDGHVIIPCGDSAIIGYASRRAAAGVTQVETMFAVRPETAPSRFLQPLALEQVHDTSPGEWETPSWRSRPSLDARQVSHAA